MSSGVNQYFCSWNKIDWKSKKERFLFNVCSQLEESPEKASTEFSQLNCLCYKPNEFEQICENHKIKKLFFDKIEYTYALIYCYKVKVLENADHITEEFQIWTLIDADRNHEDAEKLENLIY